MRSLQGDTEGKGVGQGALLGIGVRRLVLVSLLVSLVVAPAAPASAATTSFDAHFREEGGVSSAPSGTGFIGGYGPATEVFTETSETRLETGCSTTEGFVGVTLTVTGTTLMTLVSDGSTLTIRETDVGCTPGNSDFRDLHEGFAPTQWTGTFVIKRGTGVFRGAGGAGTVTSKFAGNALLTQAVIIIDYEGALTLR